MRKFRDYALHYWQQETPQVVLYNDNKVADPWTESVGEKVFLELFEENTVF